MLVKSLTSLKGKNVNIATINYVGGGGWGSNKGVVTNIVTGGYTGTFIELDSKTLINTRYVGRIEILD